MTASDLAEVVPGVPARRRTGIPDATIARLPVYLRALHALADAGRTTVSSEDLAEAAGSPQRGISISGSATATTAAASSAVCPPACRST